MFNNCLLRICDNSTLNIYSGRLLFLRTWVGLKAHPIPHFGKLISFKYVS